MAAHEEALRTVSREASGDLSGDQFKFMVTNASGQLAASGAGADADGVLQDKPDAQGKVAELGIRGVSKVLVGAGGLTAGDLVMSEAGGAAILATATNVVKGRALETGAAGEIIPVQLKDGYKL